MRRLSTLLLCGVLLLFGGCSKAVTPEQYATVVINEVVTCGAEYDWIELHNTSDTPVALDGCFLSNDEAELGKWQFPSVTLQGGDYLVLRTSTDGQTDEPALPFRLKASGTTLFFSEHNGTLIQQLDIPASASGLSYGTYEGAYTWFASPTQGKDNAAGMVLGQDSVVSSEGLRINEYMTTNRSVLYDADGSYSDWVEIYNFSDHLIDLTGYTLTDARDEAVKWVFPSGTTIASHGYVLVRCSARNTVTPNGELHTNFKLGKDDSFLGLYTRDGRFCSGITLKPLADDLSCGYVEDVGYATLRYPTPGVTNNPSVVSEVAP